MTPDEIIAEIDRPGFAFENLPPAEQRNLLGSISALLAVERFTYAQDLMCDIDKKEVIKVDWRGVVHRLGLREDAAELSKVLDKEMSYADVIAHLINDLLEQDRKTMVALCERHVRDQQEITDLKRELAMRRQKETGEVWFWQADGGNYVESITCPIVIPARDFKALVVQAGNKLPDITPVDN